MSGDEINIQKELTYDVTELLLANVTFFKKYMILKIMIWQPRCLKGGCKIRFKSSQHLRILLFIAREPQKLDRQSIYHWNLVFISFSKIQLSNILEVLVKLYPD